MTYNLLMGMDYTWFYVETNIVSIIYGHVEGDHAIKRAADALYKEKAART